MKKGRRSPLRDEPLHHLGESLDHQINDLFDTIWQYGFWVVGFLAMIVFVWIEQFAEKPMNPISITIIGSIFILSSLIIMIMLLRKVQRLKLERDGEKTVGQTLEALRQDGCAIFHNLQGNGLNLDDVVVSKHGIYVIETKTLRKPSRREARIVYDGKTVLIDGKKPARDPLVQVSAGAKWLNSKLQESTGRTFPMRGVVVFPGWFVDNSGARGSSIWVLNPQALKTFISNEPVSVIDTDLHLLSYYIACMVRAEK
jgi:Nuclease-related domain